MPCVPPRSPSRGRTCAVRLIAEVRLLHSRPPSPPFSLPPSLSPVRREISATRPAPDWEVYLYAVLVAKYALREEQAPSNAVDEAAFAQRVDAAVAGFEASLHQAFGLRRKANRSRAAAELDEVVQVRACAAAA